MYTNIRINDRVIVTMSSGYEIEGTVVQVLNESSPSYSDDDYNYIVEIKDLYSSKSMQIYCRKRDLHVI